MNADERRSGHLKRGRAGLVAVWLDEDLDVVVEGDIASRRIFPYLWDMEVHFTPEQEAQLAQIATKSGIETERLVKDAALRLLDEDAHFRAAVREGIEQADRGIFIEEEEMDARFEQMLRS